MTRDLDTEYQRNWALARIGAREAWQTGTGEGIIIAVLDTGVDLNHSDLDDSLWRNEDEIAGDGVDNDGNGFVDDAHGWDFANSDANPDDGHSHGTHVAGIIAAEDNGQGVVGIAHGSEIMAVKVLGDNASGSWASITRGIDYAIQSGAKIINMSLGAGWVPASLIAAVARAEEAGVIIVAAAGNDGLDGALYPAALAEQFDNVISVAASTAQNRLAGFSNYSSDGTTVDLAAPGEAVISAMPGGRIGAKSGTSMAAPVVAAALAVIWSAYPTLPYAQVIDYLEDTVTAIASSDKPTATNGIVNLAAAIRAVEGVKNEEPEQMTIDLATAKIEPFQLGQQDHGKHEIRAIITLTGNAWKAIPGHYVITRDTILSFDFSAQVEGEIHGVMFTNGSEQAEKRTFAVFGTQAWGIQDYATYDGSGQTQRFDIPVGRHFTGDFDRLVLVMDDDAGGGADSTFSNIALHERV